MLDQNLIEPQNGILKIEIQKMLKLGIIEIGESDYTSPMIIVKASGKNYWLWISYYVIQHYTKLLELDISLFLT